MYLSLLPGRVVGCLLEGLGFRPKGRTLSAVGHWDMLLCQKTATGPNPYTPGPSPERIAPGVKVAAAKQQE